MNREKNEVIEAMIEQGAKLLGEGLYEDAVESFSACLAVAPDTPRAYSGRAQAQFRLKRWTDAIYNFSRAFELDPEDRESGLGLALSLAMENKVYEAIDVLEELLKRFPSFVRGRIQLGLLYYKLCATAKGKAQMDLALANRPSLAERNMIEQVLKQEARLDKNRLYRPDFEALSQKNSGTRTPFSQWFKKLFKK